jgi:hypothetical protein
MLRSLTMKKTHLPKTSNGLKKRLEIKLQMISLTNFINGQKTLNSEHLNERRYDTTEKINYLLTLNKTFFP